MHHVDERAPRAFGGFEPTLGQQNGRCVYMGAKVPLIWTLYKDRLQRFGVMLPVHGNAWRDCESDKSYRINEFTPETGSESGGISG
jgi:hypothetical protein